MLYNEPHDLPLNVRVEMHDQRVLKIPNLSLTREKTGKRKLLGEEREKSRKGKNYNIEWPQRVSNEALKYQAYVWKSLATSQSMQAQGAGRGVKAKRDLKRGDCFPIMGLFRTGVFTGEEKSHLWPLGVNREEEMLWIDGRPHASPQGLNMAMMVNEPGCKGRDDRGDIVIPNAMLMNLVLMVTRDIERGEEILVYYGKRYNEERIQKGYSFSEETMKQMDEWQKEIEMKNWFGKAKQRLGREKEKIREEAREMMEEAQRGFKMVKQGEEMEMKVQLELNPRDAFEDVKKAFLLSNVIDDSPGGPDEHQLEQLDDFLEEVLGNSKTEKRKSKYAWWTKLYAGRIERKNWVMEERGGQVEIFHLMETRVQTAMEDEDAKIFFDECPIKIRNTLKSLAKWVKTEFGLMKNKGIYMVAMRTPPGATPQKWHLDSLKRTNAWILPLGPPGTPFTELKQYTVPTRPGLKSTKQEVGEWMRITQEGKGAETVATATQKRGDAMLFNPLAWHRGPAWSEEKKRGRNTIFFDWEVTEAPDIINAKWNEGEEDDDDLFEPTVAQQVFTLKPWLRECNDMREDGGGKVEQKEKKREGRTRIPKKKDITLRPALGLGGVK